LKYKKIVLFCFILVNLIAICISIEVNAQANYDFKIEEDDSFVWEVKELNKYEFEKTFGFEPAFEVAEKTRRVIQDVEETDNGWLITEELWDYGEDWDEDGAIVSEEVFDDPAEYDDNIFLPTPVDQYLDNAQEDLPSEYLVEGLRVTKRQTDYNIIREYDSNGVLVLETYENKDGIVIVKVEGTFRVIPMGDFYLGFIALAVAAIIIVMLKRKNFVIKEG
jgi:hypothetical protein